LYTVLVVGNHGETDSEITALVKSEEYNLLEAESPSSVMAVLQTYPVDVMICTFKPPDNSNLELLSLIKQQYTTIEIILMTELSDLEAVNQTIKNPSFKILNRPYDDALLLETLAQAVAQVRSQEDILAELTQLSDEKRILTESLKEEQHSHSRLESEFRSFTENSGDLFLRIDERQNLAHANPACRALLGLSDNEHTPLPDLFKRVMHSADQEKFSQGLQRVYERESDFESFALRLRTPDQSTHWVQLSLTAVQVEGEFHGASCTIQDRTASYIAQYNLKQSNRNLRVLQQFDKLLDMHLDSNDLEEQVMQALVREFNLTAALMFAPHSRGLQLVASGGQTAGMAIDTIQEADDQLEQMLNSRNPVQVASWTPEEYAGHIWRSIGDGKTLQVGFLHCTLGEGLQRYILLLDSGRDFATVSNLYLLRQIVTSLARSIANNLLFRVIREAKSDWEATFDSIPDMIAVVDKDGCILLSNEALAQFCSREVDALEGVSFNELFFESDDPNADQIQELISGGIPGSMASSGTPPDRELRFRVVPNIYSSKAISIVVVQDVTEEQQMQKRNRELELKLFQEARLSSIGLLASGIAHNLNGPLMTIMGSVDLALHHDPDSKSLQRIGRQVQVMKDIIGNLMTKSRREQETGMEELDLNQLLQDQLDFLQADMRFKHMLQKTIHLDVGFPHIMGVYADYSQVINAILNNCIEAMLESETRDLLVRTSFKAGIALLEISDTGVGMDEATRDRIFDPFFSTKKSSDPATSEYQGGTGLGMTTVYNILKNNDIRMEIESAPGKGSRFSIYFPAALQVVHTRTNEDALADE
jgi:two-component system, cell cycle sensor histidine kinase and response regulator CckA